MANATSAMHAGCLCHLPGDAFDLRTLPLLSSLEEVRKSQFHAQVRPSLTLFAAHCQS